MKYAVDAKCICQYISGTSYSCTADIIVIVFKFHTAIVQNDIVDRTANCGKHSKRRLNSSDKLGGRSDQTTSRQAFDQLNIQKTTTSSFSFLFSNTSLAVAFSIVEDLFSRFLLQKKLSDSFKRHSFSRPRWETAQRTENGFGCVKLTSHGPLTTHKNMKKPRYSVPTI